jgi:hypothetical protein
MTSMMPLRVAASASEGGASLPLKARRRLKTSRDRPLLGAGPLRTTASLLSGRPGSTPDRWMASFMRLTYADPCGENMAQTVKLNSPASAGAFIAE